MSQPRALTACDPKVFKYPLFPRRKPVDIPTKKSSIIPLSVPRERVATMAPIAIGKQPIKLHIETLKSVETARASVFFAAAFSFTLSGQNLLCAKVDTRKKLIEDTNSQVIMESLGISEEGKVIR
mmetsp:Transcript_12065/g.14640  ORF Transcript_12065/g.14640 Transcript_12065/m.14640 type:complete len:125 (+) Transcript_12065:436-810(+)